MNVIILFGKSEAPYFYQLVEVLNNTATIVTTGNGAGDNYHQIVQTPQGWKIIGVSQPHTIGFYNIGSLDECDQMYSKYKAACDKYWDLWVAPKQKPEYYVDIINKLVKCLNNRLQHHYSCEEGIDVIHANAIKKIEQKIMVARLWYASNFDVSIGSYDYYTNELLNTDAGVLVDEILTYDKENLYNIWYQTLGSLDVVPNKVQIVNMLIGLRNL